MVGVPGRSKGCGTCRKRRVRCDQGKPICGNCVKAKRECGGYYKDRIFVHSQATILPDASVSVKPNWDLKGSSKTETRDTTSRNGLSWINEGFGRCTDSESFTSSEGHYEDLADPLGPFPDVEDLVPHPTSQTAAIQPIIRAQLLSSLVDLYLPMKGSSICVASSRLWLTALPKHPRSSVVLDTATTALALAAVGSMYNDRAMIKESRKLYGRGLRQLQLALWDENQMRSDETLSACMALALYELQECPGETKKGYLSHYNGCARLVELRGPRSHSIRFGEGDAGSLGHKTFVTFRMHAFWTSMEKHRHSFLTSPEWINEPFQGMPKGLINELVDLALQGPSLLEEGDKLIKLPPEKQLAGTISMLRKCWRLDAELQFIRERIDREFTHRGVTAAVKEVAADIFEVTEILTPLPSSTDWDTLLPTDINFDDIFSGDGSMSSSDSSDSSQLENPFPMVYDFDTWEAAYCLLLLWTAQSILWAGMRGLVDALEKACASASAIFPCTTNPTQQQQAELIAAAATVDTDPPPTAEQRADAALLLSLLHDPAATHLLELGSRSVYWTPALHICRAAPFFLRRETGLMGLHAIVAPLNTAAVVLRDAPGFAGEAAWAKAKLAEVRKGGVGIADHL